MNKFEAFKEVRNRIKKFYAQMDRGLAAVVCSVLSAAAMANMAVPLRISHCPNVRKLTLVK
jgi:hypothetical protein